jgi:hypothetical protein
VKNQSLGPVTPVVGVWPLSDEALLTGLAAGDPDAAAGFVRRFQSRVFGVAVTILGDPAAARMWPTLPDERGRSIEAIR